MAPLFCRSTPSFFRYTISSIYGYTPLALALCLRDRGGMKAFTKILLNIYHHLIFFLGNETALMKSCQHNKA